MWTRRGQNRGFTILSILLVLMIIGILGSTYMTTKGPSGQPMMIESQQRARSAVASMNLRTANTQYFLTTEGRNLPIDRQRLLLDDLSRRMGQGNRYFVNERGEVDSTVNVETPTFRSRYQVPKFQ